MKTKIAITVYLLFLAMIVYAADQGALPTFLSFYREIPFGDAIGHFVLMGLLSFLATIASRKHRIMISQIPIPIGTVFVLILVFAEEASQIFIATRTFSITDIVADTAGIITFAWLGIRISARLSTESAEQVAAGKVL